MLKKGKGAQNWSIEIMIALGIFLVIFVVAIAFMYYSPSDPAFRLKRDSDKILSTMETDLAVVDGQVVDDDNLQSLEGLSCEQIQNLFAVSGEVCIHFETFDGNVVPLGDQVGIGCPGITFADGKVCGVKT